MSALVKFAERCLREGDHSAAKRSYREALFCLPRKCQTHERQAAASRINFELERLSEAEYSLPLINDLPTLSKCKSDRIRRGYRPTSIFSKIVFRYNLLCDKCNWEFRDLPCLDGLNQA